MTDKQLREFFDGVEEELAQGTDRAVTCFKAYLDEERKAEENQPEEVTPENLDEKKIKPFVSAAEPKPVSKFVSSPTVFKSASEVDKPEPKEETPVVPFEVWMRNRLHVDE